MNKNRTIASGALLAAGLAVAVSMAGCGGATTSGSSAVPSGAFISGLQPNYILSGIGAIDESGLESADHSQLYIVGTSGFHVNSGHGPASIIATNFNGGIPTGFPQGGAYVNQATAASVVKTGTSVIFGATVANGISASGQVIPINPSSVTLTSSEVPGFSQAMTFNGSAIGTGLLPNAQYYTGAFTLPFATAGLHSLTTTVADTGGNSSSTTFSVPVVTPTVGAVVADALAGPTTINPGDTATITGDAGVTEQHTADANGVVVLFAAPGSQTLTVTPSGGGTPITQTVTVVAGKTVVLSQAGGSATTATVP